MTTIHSTSDRPGAGRKVMQRMLELEKQSQQNRSRSSPPATSTAEPLSPQKAGNERNVQNHIDPSQQIIQRRRPAMADRPMSVPALSVTIPPPKSSTESSVNSQQDVEVQIDGSPRSSVCVSPSWSDFGGKKKKTEKKKKEKERKEIEKQLKKEQEKNVRSEKAAKRLSKKPPPPSKDKMPRPLVRAITAPVETVSTQPTSQDGLPNMPTTSADVAGHRSHRPSPAVLLPKNIPNGQYRAEPIGHAQSHAGTLSLPETSEEKTYHRISADAPQLPRLPLISSNWSNPGTPEESSSDEDETEPDYGARAHPFTRNPQSDKRINGTQESGGILKYSAPLRSVQLVNRSGPVRSVTWGDMSDAQAQGATNGVQFPKSQTSPALAMDDSSTSSSSMSSPSTPVAGTYTGPSADLADAGKPHGVADGRRFMIQQSITNSTHRLSAALGDVFAGKKRDGTKGGYQYPTLTQGTLEELAKRQSVEVDHGTNHTQLRKLPVRQSLDEYVSDSGAPLNAQNPSKSSAHKRRTSYVQKQRLHYQEYQLAGFEDEMKVALATQVPLPDAFVDVIEQTPPPSPPASPEASHHQSESINPNSNAGRKDQPAKPLEPTKPDQYHTFLKDHSKREEEKRESQIALPARDISPTKAPKAFLGMHRPRVGSPKRSTASEKHALSKRDGDNVVPNRAVSPVSPATVAMVSKISKAERLTGHPKATPVKSSSSPGRSSKKSALSDTSKSTVSIVKGEEYDNKSSNDGSTPKASRSHVSREERNKDTQRLPKHSLSDGDGDLDTDGDSRLSGSIEHIDTGGHGSNGQGNTAPARPFPEIIIEGIDGDGVGRKTSIKRPKSNPQLQTTAQVQDLSFLPELKHQSLVKPDKVRRISPSGSIASTAPSLGNGSEKSGQTSPPQFPLPSPPSTRPSSDDGLSLPVGASSSNFLGVRPQSYQGGSLLRPSASPRRRTMNPMGSQSGSEAAKQLKPLAKMFVICCKCQFWHDLPSKVYEAMAKPRKILEDEVDGATEGNVETRIRCQWCTHPMSTACCAGWTTVVYLHERHH